MLNSTSITYQMKRKHLSKPDRKFSADMIYDILASKSCLLTAVRRWAPDEPVIHIDDSDVVKPDGHKFEALGLVRDGSKSTDTKMFMKKAAM